MITDRSIRRMTTMMAAAGCALFAIAQEHPFLAHYALSELPGAIRIDWTIQGGSTCNGQDVERSTDGVGFVPVHRIEGICGDPGTAVAYAWTDEAPPELSTVYYRIKLGADGYSSVKAIVFTQLTTTEHLLFPNPAFDLATLLLNTRFNRAVEVFVFDCNGRVVLELADVNGPLIELPLGAMPAGVYGYLALVDGQRLSGSFVKF